MDLMERTVVRCAEGHVFSTTTFPMQQLDTARIGPGRLIRCPRCARLRHAVPVAAAEPVKTVESAGPTGPVEPVESEQR
ncbi:hypothetical protein KQY30_16280 [Streptomyces sp. GMY02]|uniref:hypothetical protein n=1 Tax=Streptomyces sp. GMY02 TaxID=1333528 RepID=UPI001C2C7F24|nr:hypothetical protein [Streptomyces sp. GMY02]QXE39639.1 hypothetical protein KQY30_16280 [Streptomyces sp. GMY02]